MKKGARDREKADLVLMVDLFCACIETCVFPSHGSACHRFARKLVDNSGFKPLRRRRRLPKDGAEKR